MHEEIWVTKFFNDNLAGLGNAALNLVGWPSVARPWTNYVTMEIVVALLIVIVFALLKTGLSATQPGKLQQVFELMYEFITGQADETVGHGAGKYMSFFGTLFIFVLFCNLIGIIPSLESPTMYPAVPLGCAMAVFLYYNIVGVASVGVGGYLKHFLGPIWWLAPLMIVVEIVSHMARPLSLTVRLFANMFAGEKLTMVFLSLTYVLVPAVFMGLHVFVSLIQAFVFMILTMIYVSSATAHEH
jgi:F-type H+-transporting ATPase subunit a